MVAATLPLRMQEIFLTIIFHIFFILFYFIFFVDLFSPHHFSDEKEKKNIVVSVWRVSRLFVSCLLCTWATQCFEIPLSNSFSFFGAVVWSELVYDFPFVSLPSASLFSLLFSAEPQFGV